MKKQTFLWIAVAGLFLLNLCTIGFLYFQHPATAMRRMPPKRFDHILIETLQLDQQQINQFDQLKREHHEQILQLDAEIKAPITSYFYQLINGKDTANNAVLERRIAEIYLAKLNTTYQHFDDIKKICRPDQVAHFNELIPEMMQVMESNPHMKRDNHP